ncbi:MAG: NUMOD3 domain-containing DNA-binding protein [Candidatus Paceibacterota bacterium]|jgi:hypothetical protein
MNTGFIPKPIERTHCLQCGLVIVDHVSRKRKYCTRKCFDLRVISDETRQKLSDANKGKTPKNLLYMQKKSADARRGKHLPLAQRIKIGLASLGKHHSEETKRKFSESKSGTKNPMYGKGYRQIGKNNPSYKHGLSNTSQYKSNMSHRWRRMTTRNTEGSHTIQEWEELKKEFHYMCLCCKRIEPEIILTQDHIIPTIQGGTDYINNIQPLCRSCNSRKHAKHIDFISQYYELYEAK